MHRASPRLSTDTNGEAFGGDTTLPKSQYCFFFFLRKSNKSFIFIIHQTTELIETLVRRCVCFNIEGCWSLTGNWIQSSALASTCQSLGELCWPCDNTWPPTRTETRKHGGAGGGFGRAYGGVLVPKWLTFSHNCPLGQEGSRLSVRWALTEAGSGIMASRVILSVCDVRQLGLWQQPRVGAVTFDPNCKNDLNLHSLGGRGYTWWNGWHVKQLSCVLNFTWIIAFNISQTYYCHIHSLMITFPYVEQL